MQCGNPGWAFNGELTSNRTTYQVGEEVHYGCSSGFTKVIEFVNTGVSSHGTCLRNGSWDILSIPCGIIGK